MDLRLHRLAAFSLLLGACAVTPASLGPAATDPGGKADDAQGGPVAGLYEGTPEALGVLEVANEASGATLDDEVGLRSDAVSALLAARPIRTLAELLAIDGIGEVSVRRLFAFADLNDQVDYGEVPSAPGRMIAIGDLHGDARATHEVLEMIGAIDETGRWIGGDLVVVQVGDVLDRGDGEAEILALVERLEVEARQAGGALVMLLGNHELMNAAGDFRYVTEAGFDGFGDAPSEGYDDLDPQERARAAAFLPGGRAARFLARHDVIAHVGDTLFAHAGVLPDHVDYGIANVNHEAREFLIFEGLDMPPLLDDEDGPVWYRGYGTDEDVDCALVEETLSMTGAERMVIGHTVQSEGITSACDDRLYRVDVGMSAYYGGPIEALEITGGEAYVWSLE